MVSHLGTCGEWVARTRTPAAYFSLQPFVGLPLFTREDDSKNFLDLLALGLKLFCPVLRVLRLGTVGLSFGRNPILSIQTFSRSNQSLDEPASSSELATLQDTDLPGFALRPCTMLSLPRRRI